jgi:hypothetical protein
MTVMNAEDFFRLFDRCVALAEKVPPERRRVLMEIAVQCLRLAEECIYAGRAPPEPNAPTIHRLQ